MFNTFSSDGIGCCQWQWSPWLQIMACQVTTWSSADTPWITQIARSWAKHGAHLGPVGPRWAPRTLLSGQLLKNREPGANYISDHPCEICLKLKSHKVWFWFMHNFAISPKIVLAESMRMTLPCSLQNFRRIHETKLFWVVMGIRNLPKFQFTTEFKSILLRTPDNCYICHVDLLLFISRQFIIITWCAFLIFVEFIVYIVCFCFLPFAPLMGCYMYSSKAWSRRCPFWRIKIYLIGTGDFL